MRITEAQLIVLLQTTIESNNIADGGVVFSFGPETRREVANDVLRQQDAVLEATKAPEPEGRS